MNLIEMYNICSLECSGFVRGIDLISKHPVLIVKRRKKLGRALQDATGDVRVRSIIDYGGLRLFLA